MRILFALLLLAVNGCAGHGFIGRHIPIDGPEGTDEKLVLAKKILSVLPASKIHEEVKRQFPELSSKQVANVYVGSEIMTFHREGQPDHVEAHLVVRVFQNPPVKNTDTILDFVASRLQTELEHQRAQAPTTKQ